MIRIVIRKLWKGHMVSIRDYIVKSGIESGGIEVNHDNETMYISPEVLKEGQSQTKEVQSKYNDKKYSLVDFRWNPDDNNQERLI